MGKAFGLFWVVFILYFIFAHPAIIYYNTDFQQANLSEQGPNTALFLLALSLLLWTVVFSFLLWLIIKYSFVTQRNIKKIQNEGRRLRATIVEVKLLKSPKVGAEAKSIVLELLNLEGETIRHTISFTDSKPHENRYQVGKALYLRVDEDFKHKPYIALEESFSRINGWLFLLWATFLGAVLYYFQFSYSLESAGYGWRFLTFWHPLIVVPLCALFFPGVIFAFLKFLIFKKMNIGKDATILKFKGKKTWAKVLDAQQTGTQINDQPEVRFNIQYTNQHGQAVVSKITKIVSLIDVGSVKAVREREIFYDPNNPKNIAFVEDMSVI